MSLWAYIQDIRAVQDNLLICPLEKSRTLLIFQVRSLTWCIYSGREAESPVVNKHPGPYTVPEQNHSRREAESPVVNVHPGP